MLVYGPYDGVIRDVHDGDTVGVDVDLGFSHFLLTRNPRTGGREITCRLYGINAPELSTPEGVAARDYLRTLLPLNGPVKVSSHGWDRNGGRFDGTIVVGLLDVAQQMVDAGHAVPFP